MILSSTIVMANAADYENNTVDNQISLHIGDAECNNDVLEEQLAIEFFDYCGGNDIDWSSPGMCLSEKRVSIKEYKETENAVFFSGYYWWISPLDAYYFRRFGDFAVCSNSLHEPSLCALYVRIYEKIYTIEEAWGNGLVTDLACVEGFSKLTKINRIGDVDLDCSVTILDATFIQRKSAKLTSMRFNQQYVADFDEDSKVTIMDATAIQRIVAKK